MQQDNEYEIDLLELFHVIKTKIVAIIICAVIGAIVTGLYSFFIVTPMYSSTSKLYILSQSTSITSLADIQMGSSLATDYVELIKSRPVVEKVIKDMKLDMEYEDMLGKMTVENPADTRILKITIADAEPSVAMEITNDFAEVAKKQMSEIMKTDEPSIVEKGVIDDRPISPNKRRNVAMGILIGAILSAGYFIVRHLLDDTIKGSDDVEKYLELDTIGVIPLIDGEGQVHNKVKKVKAKRKHHKRKES